jgi:hypothetical protein
LPKVGPAAIFQLLSDLKQFVTDPQHLLDPTRPPAGANLVFSLDDNYLQLPEYLGGGVLGTKGRGLRFDTYATVAQLLNALKTLSVNRLIQVLPLEYRVGRAEAAFAFLAFNADWLLTTPDEFRQGTYRELSLSEEGRDGFLAVLPAVTPPDQAAATPSADEGLVVFMRGGVSLPHLTDLEAVFGLAASGSLGFQTGFRLSGTVADVVHMELIGRLTIDAPSLTARMQGGMAPSPEAAISRWRLVQVVPVGEDLAQPTSRSVCIVQRLMSGGAISGPGRRAANRRRG